MAGRYGNYSGGTVRATGKEEKQWRTWQSSKNHLKTKIIRSFRRYYLQITHKL
jgi:hypothetical protein